MDPPPARSAFGAARLAVFPGYEDFTFHDAMPYRGSALTLDLGEVRTDAQGRAVLALPLEKLRGGTLIAAFLSKALSRAADVP